MAKKKGKSKLSKDPGCRSVPGFLERSNVPRADARSYAQWNKKDGPDARSTEISLPSSGK